jgi:hypothetical protein
MGSPGFYRQQAHRCVILSRATADPNVRLWLTDLANDYVEKADAALFRMTDPPRTSKDEPHPPR